jgi:hypothetical protein
MSMLSNICYNNQIFYPPNKMAQLKPWIGALSNTNSDVHFWGIQEDYDYLERNLFSKWKG